MANKKKHKQRIEELEEIFEQVEDTGTRIEIDEADRQRYAIGGQLDENIFWSNLPEKEVILNSNHDEINLSDIKEKARQTTEAGYLPKQKPLLYRLDYHEMARQAAIIEVDIEQINRLSWKEKEYLKLLGRIEECADWLRVQDAHGDWGTLIVGKEGREAKMPTFGTSAEVDMAIQNRHLGIGFQDEVELKKARIGVFKEMAQAQIEAVNEANKEAPKEE
jgi:hypothetical protein